MKLPLVYTLFLCLSISSYILAYSESQATSWKLVDNFDFSDTSTEKLRNDPNWLIDDEPENLCAGENIYQYSCHRLSNVVIREGNLQLEATVNGNSKNTRFIFNTGKVTCNKTWRYGKFVMRAMLPQGKLLRSTFVLRPKGKKYNGTWLDNGQMNGLVYAQQGDAITAGLHYRMDENHSYVGRKMATKQNITSSFHLYTVEWTTKAVRFFFDEVLFFENAVTKPFDQPFYFVLQLGVGGPEFDTRHIAVQSSDAAMWRNSKFSIDYIKVYQEASAHQATGGASSIATFSITALCSIALAPTLWHLVSL